MFCPRCGRPVSDIANFCGGCGLPKAEIEKAYREKAEQMPAPVAAPENEPVNIEELNNTIETLENDLSGISPVVDYTTEPAEDTNTISTPSDFIQQEIMEENKKAEQTEPVNYYGQSQYSRNAPQHPEYTYHNENRTYNYVPPVAPAPEVKETAETSKTLSVVDYVWMMLISSIPVVGLIYLIWMGFVQNENPNKTNFARATLIISVFAFILSLVFAMGLIITQVSMFY